MNNNEAKFKMGDVLVSSWGYSMTIVNFYRVIGVTKTCVYLDKHKNKIVEGDGWSGKVVMSEFSDTGEDSVIRRKVKTNYKGEPCVDITECQRAYKWDGTPKYFNNMD